MSEQTNLEDAYNTLVSSLQAIYNAAKTQGGEFACWLTEEIENVSAIVDDDGMLQPLGEEEWHG